MTRDKIDVNTIEVVLDELKDWLAKKLKQKSGMAFVSRKEVLGVISQEYFEVEREIHSRDDKKTQEELYDLAVGCLWSIASLRTTKNG